MKTRTLLTVLLAAGLLLGATLTLACPALSTASRRVVIRSDALPALSSLEVALAGPHIGQSDVPYTFTASVAPLTALLPLTFT